MKNENLERMIRLADEFFDAKSDPMQISVGAETMELLRSIHPNTMGEIRNKKGPIAWALVLPTTSTLMKAFISKKISEKDLLMKTPLKIKYDALYLCSVLVLPEERGKGLAKRLLRKSIKAIKRKHPIGCFFYWGFSREGKGLASVLGKEFDLPVYARKA